MMDVRRALLESLAVVLIGGLGALATQVLPLRAPAGAVAFARASEAVRVEGVLTPALIGMNTLTFQMQDAAGRPLEGAEVEVTWFPQDAGLTIARQMGEVGAGRYSVRNLALTDGGRWQLLVRVRAADQSVLWTVDWVTGSGGDLRLTEDPAARAAWIDPVNAYGLPVSAAIVSAAVLIWVGRVFAGLIAWQRRS